MKKHKTLFQLGILTTFDNPTYPLIIEEIQKTNIDDFVIIFDSKSTSQKDLAIWQDRTGGFFDKYRDKIYEISDHHMPAFFVQNHNGIECLNLLKERNISMLLNAGTPRKISNQILQAVPSGVLNVHPGVLPFYRGSSCVEWAILHDSKVGNTAHFMSDEYDEGEIIYIETYNFSKKDSYQDIRNKVLLNGCCLAAKVLEQLFLGKIDRSKLKKQSLGEGRFWRPMPDNTLAEVKQKVLTGTYKYQILD